LAVAALFVEFVGFVFVDADKEGRFAHNLLLGVCA
jgi:hypothetical protein